jgi:hypothetical protein
MVWGCRLTSDVSGSSTVEYCLGENHGTWGSIYNRGITSLDERLSPSQEIHGILHIPDSFVGRNVSHLLDTHMFSCLVK